MRKAVGLVAVPMIVLVLVGCDASSRPSSTSRSTTSTTAATRPATTHNACWSAVDDLSNEVSAATNTSDIPASVVLASFRACGAADSWEKYAEIDQIGNEVSGLGDTSGPYTASTALDVLCARFDKLRKSDTCKLR